MRSGVDTKSGQEVAKHGFGKTDVRYWHDAIFKTKYTRFGHALEIAYSVAGSARDIQSKDSQQSGSGCESERDLQHLSWQRMGCYPDEEGQD